MEETLLQIKNVKKFFPIRRSFLGQARAWVRAVDGVSLSVMKGETLALVGETGCGKSTLARTILRLFEPTAGEIFFKGSDILTFDKNRMRKVRKDMQMIFQDPLASLDPRKKIKDIIGEGLDIQKMCSGAERMDRICLMIERVGLEREFLNRYPHEFSGGQRQRISIARALVLNPELIIADEPVSALDVSVKAQIINLFMDLQYEYALSYLFITHDLLLVEHLCDRVAVMYLGKVCEMGKRKKVFSSPLHPYTQALFSSIPVPDPQRKKKKMVLQGEVPSAVNPPPGCNFHPRCKNALGKCREISAELIEVGEGHWVACHLHRM